MKPCSQSRTENSTDCWLDAAGYRRALLALGFGLCAATLPMSPVLAETPTRRVEVAVFGEDPCPQSTGDEIVVCGRQPEGERYRIPKQLRNPGKPVDQSGPNESWVAKTATLGQFTGSTVPGSCSAVGSYGQSGCSQQILAQWYRDRQAQANLASPGG